MTQLSVQYACSPTIGDYGPLTAENLAEMNLFIGNVHNQTTGLIWWKDASRIPRITTTLGTLTNPVDGLLEPTESGGIVTIDTGVALVNGYLYFNDVAVTFDIDANPGNVNATDVIALRWTTATQAVRLVRLNGAVGTKAALTQSSSTWEVAIAEIVLDGAGQFSSLVDVRALAVSTGTVMKLDTVVSVGGSGTVTFNNIPAAFTSLRIIATARSTAGGGIAMVTSRLNNDSGNNYEYATFSHDDGGVGVTLGGAAGVAQFQVGNVAGGGAAANFGGGIRYDILNAKDTTFYKNLITRTLTRGATETTRFDSTGVWLSQAKVTRIDLILAASNFVAGSTFDLYGIV